MSTIRCEECGIGRCHPVTTPYLLQIGRHMLVLPDSPAYTCDICGNRFFDAEMGGCPLEDRVNVCFLPRVV